MFRVNTCDTDSVADMCDMIDECFVKCASRSITNIYVMCFRLIESGIMY